MIRLNDIDAIIFDLGGVILNLDYNLTINAFKELGGENFDNLYTQAYQNNLFDKYETGEMSSEEFVSYLQSFLPDHINDEQVKQAWNKMLLNLPPKRLDLINELRKTHKVYLFSNTNDLHYKNFNEHLSKAFGPAFQLNDYFDQAYYSHFVGKRKPNSDAFMTVVNDHKLNKERTLFIDDSIQHVEGAKQTGLMAYHLKDEDIIDIFDL